MHAQRVLPYLALVLILAFAQVSAAAAKTDSRHDDGTLREDVWRILEAFGVKLEWSEFEGEGDPTKFLRELWKDKIMKHIAGFDSKSYCFRGESQAIRDLTKNTALDACQSLISEIPGKRVFNFGWNIYQEFATKVNEQGHGKNSGKLGHLNWAPRRGDNTAVDFDKKLCNALVNAIIPRQCPDDGDTHVLFRLWGVGR
ncbi:hypothetical protein F5Y13DRAFT_131002 [Hypoxylon sp. FL1857]|nr:hypothetical protein F5Y13DRAFT_131002 [Hypoxylon sp. FL1857]